MLTSCGLLVDPDELTEGSSDSENLPTGGDEGAGGTVSVGGEGGASGDLDECTWFRDSDGDGYGDPDDQMRSCEILVGYVSNMTDCDDSDDHVHPGAVEYCDGKNNDCEGSTADDCPMFCDGFASDSAVYMVCAMPQPYSEAEMACDEQEMVLARIDDAEENALLVEQLGELKYAWIGATDTALEGEWVWADGTVFYKDGAAVGTHYSNWYSDEPSVETNEDCGEIWDDGFWNAYACEAPQAFICERY